MADIRAGAQGYKRPELSILMNFTVALAQDDAPVKRIKQALDINHCSVVDTLVALAFTCDPDKKHDINTPPALHAFVPAFREAALDDRQNKALQQALIDTLPDHLSDEIRGLFPCGEEVGHPAATQRKLAQWLDENTRPAELIESLLGLPDPGERVLDALEHVWLGAPHASIARFQDDLASARSSLKDTGDARNAAYEDAVSGFTLYSMGRAVQSQLASLAGFRAQFVEMRCADLLDDLQRAEAVDLIDLHRVASAVMQPLAGAHQGEKIDAMRSIINGETDTNYPASKAAYEQAKSEYLVRNPGKASEATAKFEKAFLYRLAGTLPPRSREAAHKLIKEAEPHDAMKTRLFELFNAYNSFMNRVIPPSRHC